MIRFAIAVSLFATAAHAETKAVESDLSRSLAFCGSQVATLTWFYQGAVNEGSADLKSDLDGLLSMQSIFINQVQLDGDETIDLFKRMTKASVNELAEQMQGTREDGAEALADLNTNVRSCVGTYFENVEDETDQTDDTAKSDEN